jgi:hypothetical protein
MSRHSLAERAGGSVPWVTVGMILAAAATRLLPHPPNFTPVLAIALFGGARFQNRKAALAVPLVAMLLSDLGLEIVGRSGFYALMPVVYGAVAACTVVGFALQTRPGIGRTLAAAVAASVLFYVTTNLAVWLAGDLYPMTATGLAQCYVAALPFFRNTLASTVLYSAALFAGHEVILSRLIRSPRGA